MVRSHCGLVCAVLLRMRAIVHHLAQRCRRATPHARPPTPPLQAVDTASADVQHAHATHIPCGSKQANHEITNGYRVTQACAATSRRRHSQGFWPSLTSEQLRMRHCIMSACTLSCLMNSMHRLTDAPCQQIPSLRETMGRSRRALASRL